MPFTTLTPDTEKLICIRIINMVFTHLPERVPITEEASKLIKGAGSGDRWRLISVSIKRTRKQGLEAQLLEQQGRLRDQEVRMRETSTPRRGVARAEVERAEDQPALLEEGEVTEHKVPPVERSGAQGPQMSLGRIHRDLAPEFGEQDAQRLVEQLKEQILQYQVDLDLDYYSEAERQGALRQLQLRDPRGGEEGNNGQGFYNEWLQFV